MTEQEIKKKWKEDWERIWKPCLMTKGKFSEKKIKNEMHDLVFIFEQVGKVYMELTGGMLSKPMYYADVIISQNNEALQESYDKGYNDAVEDLSEKQKPAHVQNKAGF